MERVSGILQGDKSVSRTPIQVELSASALGSGEGHLSTDDPKDRAAIYGMHVGEALARQHTQDAQNILPVYAENTSVTLDTREAMIAGMWSAYLAHLVGHIRVAIGDEATDEMLHTLAEMHLPAAPSAH